MLDRCITSNLEDSNLEDREEFDLLNKYIPYSKENERVRNEIKASIDSSELTIIKSSYLL